ncbi:hypothetical protein AA0114_g11882 [Alternaria tenuissima]|uniref:Uncharacterized protein n=1 Tax=Alternaria tenuissima TaxID=119927 RepID=A0A4Q4M1K2_9PLEO|nr:hypothetical protein AA0114_g11882 [Alternaria tenuissima]
MSAPNANNPNEGIIGQAVNSVKNAANYVSETVQGQSAEASKEGNKQQAKGNVPGQDSITDREARGLRRGQQALHLSTKYLSTGSTFLFDSERYHYGL